MSLVKSHIGGYRIVRILGEGGMGTVYEAVHDGIDRRVAVKILHPEYARKPEIVRRFLNEARAVNVVSHPGLVQISECGQSEDGTAFLVMEYLDGDTLGGRLKKRADKKLTEAQVVGFAWQLATALAAAHATGIVHRDLKPSNVMLVPDPTVLGGERVKLLDFGIAKLGQQIGRNDGLHTRTGVTMGTPSYMAPEQCLGAANVDGKADVYSLGVMMFEMLTGTPPFVADAELVLLNMHVSKAPPVLRTIAPTVSDAVAQLVQRMLSKAAGERPTMAEVVRVLQLRDKPLQQSASSAFDPEDAGQTKLLTRNSTPLRSNGEQQTIQRKSRALLAFSTVVGLGGVILVAVLSLGHRQPSANPERPGAREDVILGAAAESPSKTQSVSETPKVVTEITSQPLGAMIIRVGDNKLLGVTPWRQEQPAQPSSMSVELRFPGYQTKSLTVRLDQDTSRKETLAVEPRLRKPQPPPRVVRVAEEKRQPLPSTPSKTTERPKVTQEKNHDPLSRIVD